MADIKKVLFKGLTSTNLAYTALGGIRFYDRNGTMISDGATITSGLTSAETDNFLITATSTYSTAYYPIYSIDTANGQTGTHANTPYWLTANENQTFTVEFKTALTDLSKIEFNPLPASDYTNRGVDENFTIEVQDGAGAIIQSYTVTPITTNDTVQTLDTPELVTQIKYLFEEGTDVKSLKTTDLTPVMTSANTPSPYVVSANSYSGTDYPWKAFDDNPDSRSYWYVDVTRPTGGHWLKIDLGSQKVVDKISLETADISDGNDKALKNWELYGSNDDVTYTLITTGLQAENELLQDYRFENSTSYRYYRLNCLDSYSLDFPESNCVRTMKIYDSSWVVIGTSPATETMFLNDGMNDLTDLADHQFQLLTSNTPKLLYYTQSGATTKDSKLTAVPPEKVILANGDIDLTNVSNIDSFTLTANISGSGVVKTIVSFDGGTTWYAWDSGTLAWVVVDSTLASDVKSKGMTPTTFNGVASADWESLRGASNKIRFGYYLEQTTTTDVANTDKLDSQFDMKGTWKHYKEADYEYIDNTTNLNVTLYDNGDFKINYH